MATSVLPSLLLLLLFSLLAATSSARPCKTIFFYSTSATITTTTTYYPHRSHPNLNSALRHSNPRHVTFVFASTTANPFPNRRPSVNFNPDPSDSQSSPAMTSSGFPLKFYSTVSSSVRDRTKDIMSVVGALLFGVACGALTGAIMYFVWALFSSGRFDFADDVDDYDDEDEDDVAASKRKSGYVAIPAVTDDLKKPAPPANDAV